MEKPISRITLSPSVERTIDFTQKSGATSAWELCIAMLKRHPEYVGAAHGVIDRIEPRKYIPRDPPKDWIEKVTALFDPVLVRQIHGRLMILGLSRLDASARQELATRGYLEILDTSLHEDFESLLRPEHADKQKYRREFVHLINNRSKSHPQSESWAGPPRETGFVALVTGGLSLEGLAELTQRQTWNTCLSARYAVPRGSLLNSGMARFFDDLGRLAASDTPLGALLPDPSSRPQPWREAVRKGLGDVAHLDASDEGLYKLGSAVQNALGKGQRLILLFEFYGVSPDVDPETIGFTSTALDLLAGLPERMGVVLSGLPASVHERLAGPHARVFEIPGDSDPTRSQAFDNDLPRGVDQLNLREEVNAIAEAIALSDMSPPLVVGILGGWGSGKSFVLHLLEQRLVELRCNAVVDEESFPFVGHPYVIRFDAWTYAKGDLWASLMHKTFTELDIQLGIEQVLREKVQLDSRDESELWRLITSRDRDTVRRVETVERGGEKIGEKAVRLLRENELIPLTSELWETLEQERKTQRCDQERYAQRAAAAGARHGESLGRLHDEVRDRLEADTRRRAWERIADKALVDARNVWQSRQKKEADPESPLPASETIPTLREMRNTFRWYRRWLTPGTISGSLGVLLIAVFLAILIWGEPLQAGREISSAIALIGSVAATVFGSLTRFQKIFQDYQERFDTALEEEQLDLDERCEARVQGLLNAVLPPGTESRGPGAPVPTDMDPELKRLAGEAIDRGRKADEAKTLADVACTRIGLTARNRSLLELVQDRSRGGFYDDHLGLLHQVQSDLLELSETLLGPAARKKLFRRGRPRVFLLIDDLDRCPPDKVVQVLEAVQLLVKTDLFVVVLAMDVRYITRALEKEYDHVLIRGGHPSGLDYIEKILQIPYRMLPPKRTTAGSFLRSQMRIREEDLIVTSEPAPRVGETDPDGSETDIQRERREERTAVRVSPTQPAGAYRHELPRRILEFTSIDHTTISDCCAAVEVSPRTMKRLVNIFKLLKIIWFRRGHEKGPPEPTVRAILGLLALAARYPEPLRQVLYDLERVYEQTDEAQQNSISEKVRKICEGQPTESPLADSWDELALMVESTNLFDPDLNFRSLGQQNLRLASCFSFIGDPDPRPVLDSEIGLTETALSGESPPGAIRVEGDPEFSMT